MKIIPLYRYTRPDGGVTVSPVKPAGEYTEAFRLVAEEGKLLAREGAEPTPCTDTDSAEGWYEIEDTEKQEEHNDE